MSLPVTYERFQVSQSMKNTLKSYILKQRQKKKEEEEQDAVLHRERKKREIKRQQDTATLEQTNEQIEQLEKKMETLKKEKHDLFAQLKKVLNQEEEQRRRVQQMQLQHDREKSEVLAKVGPGPLPPNLLLPGASPPQGMLPKSVSVAGSSPGQALPSVFPSAKRPRSPSPHTSTVVCQSPQSGFLSPKHSTPPYQRSPYQSAGPVFSPRGIIPPPTMDSSRFLQQMPSIHTPVVVSTPFNRIPIELDARSPQYEVRPVAPQATHLPARIPQHIPPVSIPILPPQQKMGSITSGFPLHRPTGNIPVGLPSNRLQYIPKNLSGPQNFPASHQRM